VWPFGQHVSGLGGAYLSNGSDVALLTAVARNVAAISNIGSSDPLDFVGFRLAYVPEPSTMLLAIVGLGGLCVWLRHSSH